MQNVLKLFCSLNPESRPYPAPESGAAHFCSTLFSVPHRLSPGRTSASRRGIFYGMENIRLRFPVRENKWCIPQVPSCLCQTKCGPGIFQKRLLRRGVGGPVRRSRHQTPRSYSAMNRAGSPRCARSLGNQPKCAAIKVVFGCLRMMLCCC